MRYIETRLVGVTLRRGDRRVLTSIHWYVRPGQRWVLLGLNGSGKTQLLKVVAGIVRPTGARPTLRWRFKGEWHDVPYELKEHIAYLGPERQDKYQRYAWNMTAEDAVGTGLQGTDIPLEKLAPAGRRRVRALLQRLGVAFLSRRRLLELSYGERRMVLLARALLARPKLLLLDEVFTGLDRENHARLLDWLTRLRGKLPLVIATHQLEDVPLNATHALVLRQGQVVYCGRLQQSVLARHFGATAGGSGRTHAARVSRTRAVTPRPRDIVQLTHARVYLDERCALKDVSLTVRAGEFWVIHGPNGAGKTTLLRTLYGDHGVAAGGGIVRRGIGPGVPLERFRERTGIAAPYLHARYPRAATVGDVVLSGRHASIGLHRTATGADRAAALRVLRRLKLAKWAQRPLGELSYGQVRLVLLARALVRKPRLLLLDEPLDSVDAVTRGILIREIEKAAAQGTAVVVTAHSRLEWHAHASHEIELKSGGVRYCGERRALHHEARRGLLPPS
jgi:molybdate transport system ATP-binding protein